MSHKFKKGDIVFLVKRGSIEWETGDWTMVGNLPRLRKNIKYTILELGYYHNKKERPCVDVDGLLYHEDHFKKYEIQK